MADTLQFVVSFGGGKFRCQLHIADLGMTQRMSDMLQLVVSFGGDKFRCNLNLARVTTS